MKIEEENVAEYENKYQAGYGIEYPETHVIRVHKQIIQWELGIKSGNVFDFGCGTGAHLKYFNDQSFNPYGCDSSPTAIEKCKKLLPKYADNFVVTPVVPDLIKHFSGVKFDVFMANQVLYYLQDKNIRKVVEQAFALVRPGGVFFASMISNTSSFACYGTGHEGDFMKLDLKMPRISQTASFNFKDRKSIDNLFRPFKRLHLGSYSQCIREEEGPTDHWLYVGIK